MCYRINWHRTCCSTAGVLLEPQRALPRSFHDPTPKTMDAIAPLRGLLVFQVCPVGSYSTVCWWKNGSFRTLRYCVFAHRGSRQPSSWSTQTSCYCSADQYRREGNQQSFRRSRCRAPTNLRGMSDLSPQESQELDNQECRRMSKLIGCLQALWQDRNQ